MATLKGERISARHQDRFRKICDRVIEYVLSSANVDAFNYLQEYLVAFLEDFIELPGSMTFEDICLQCMAALHPPTYVHSLQVADLSRCLSGYLLEKSPELFMEEFGFTAPEQVADNSTQIMQFIYKGGLCHDFGKMAMIDTIFVYGRALFDSEFEIIRSHARMGAIMLSAFESTGDYADLALQHHIWYDRRHGYPETEAIGHPVATDILSVADTLDAATDSIGRSYSSGKTLEEIIAEIQEDSGTRYAPYVAELLRDERVREDIDYILTEGRQHNYVQTYLLLSGVKKRMKRYM